MVRAIHWLRSPVGRLVKSGIARNSRIARSSVAGSATPLSSTHPSEQGLTLLECLVAILIVTLTLVAMTPPLFLAVATRIQARRAQQAMQIAQGEVDRLKVVLERGGYQETSLPVSVGPDISTAPAPTQVSTALRSNNPDCNTYDNSYPSVETALRVDTTGDCTPAFLLQVFRDDGRIAPGQTVPMTFKLGIRIYSAVALDSLGQLQTTAASLKFTTGRGNLQFHPISTLYSVVTRTDSSFALRMLQDEATNAPRTSGNADGSGDTSGSGGAAGSGDGSGSGETNGTGDNSGPGSSGDGATSP